MNSRWFAGALPCSLLACTAGLGADSPHGAEVPDSSEDGQLTTAAGNPPNTRYGGLDQIKTDNEKDLKVAWTFSTGVNRGQEAAPIVVGKTMYAVTPYPNILYGLDLEKGRALKWSYLPEPASAAQGIACCDTVNRGAVYADGTTLFAAHQSRWAPRARKRITSPAFPVSGRT